MLFVIWCPHGCLEDKSKSNLAKKLHFDCHQIGFAYFQSQIPFSVNFFFLFSQHSAKQQKLSCVAYLEVSSPISFISVWPLHQAGFWTKTCKLTNIHAQILHFKPCNWVKMGNYFKRESQGPLGHMFNCSCSPLTASFSSPWSATAVSVAVVIRHGSFTSVGERRRRWWRCHRQCSTEVQHQNRAANDLYHSCSLLLSDAMLT